MLRRSACLRTFKASALKDLTTAKNMKRPLPSMKDVKFGTLFAPSMVEIDWSLQNGWEAPVMKDFGPLSLMPQIGALHYALQTFEGMKAYRDEPTDTVRMFRPDMNAARLNRSFDRLCFPAFDNNEFVEVLKIWLRANRHWIPTEANHSLYIRPNGIGNNHNLRVGPADSVKLYIIGSPVGPYYPGKFEPVKLYADRENKRAWPGGTGAHKLGANYAGPMYVQKKADAMGYQQILWLAPDDTMDEVGAMNFMFLWKNEQGERELVTAPLDGTILPGVTRDSILKMCKQWGEFKVTEKRVKIQTLVEKLVKGDVEEMFGCGTAAIVTAIKALHFDGTEYAVPTGDNTVTMRVMKELTDIQYGRKAHEWSVTV